MINTAETMYGCRVTSVVSDNAANMNRFRDLCEIDMPDKIYYSCAAHSSNLLSKSICKLSRYDIILSQTAKIIKYFTHKKVPNGWYRREGGKGLVLGKSISWNTFADQLKSYLTNYDVLLRVCNEHGGQTFLSDDIGKHKHDG